MKKNSNLNDKSESVTRMDILDWNTAQKPICRAVWAVPLQSEKNEGAPEQRIIHSRLFSSARPVTLKRIGIRSGKGYFKCGGENLPDWVRSLRVLTFEQNDWREVCWFRDLQRPSSDDVVWLDDLNLSTQAFIVEVRESGVDAWWTSWNLAMTGVVLESELITAGEIPLDCLRVSSVEKLPQGCGFLRGDTVHYRFDGYEVAFHLRQPCFSHFRMRGLMPDVELQNQIRGSSHGWIWPQQSHLAHLATQGPRLWLVGSDLEAGYGCARMQGNSRVDGNQVFYDLLYPDSGLELKIIWTLEPEGMTLEVQRKIPEGRFALFDSAWSLVFDAAVTPVSTIGETLKQGETGQVATPFLLHSPRGGTFRIGQSGAPGMWRYDAVRPLEFTSAQWHVGSVAQSNGTYWLEPGTHHNRMEWRLSEWQSEISQEAPRAVREMVDRCLPTAFAYRPDAATLSNNSASIHCFFCLDSWVELAKAFPSVHGISTRAFLLDTLTRWLTGGPSYASGVNPNTGRLIDEEYTHSLATPLYALSEYLLSSDDLVWEDSMMHLILRKLEHLESMDSDGDGLIESEIRRGISGEHQWSTNWWDVISFGYKDAFANVTIYPMLKNMARVMERRGDKTLAEKMLDWAKRLKESYHQMFWNKETGWYGGWRDGGGVLHDYGFLFVNGAAVRYGLVPEELAAPVMRALYNELEMMNPPYHLGIPGNLRKVPNEDLAGVLHNLPYGWYENGGLTHSQSKHFLGGLYKAGLTAEADALLEKMACGLADGEVFAGLGSGMDWRLWNGGACGYEGLLVDQFGLLALAKYRWTA